LADDRENYLASQAVGDERNKDDDAFNGGKADADQGVYKIGSEYQPTIQSRDFCSKTPTEISLFLGIAANKLSHN
jgi:hypothetical protein